MAFTEEVFKNKGKWYGGHTGKLYEKGDVEEKGVGTWSKPDHAAPGEIVLELEKGDQTKPEGNGRGKC